MVSMSFSPKSALGMLKYFCAKNSSTDSNSLSIKCLRMTIGLFVVLSPVLFSLTACSGVAARDTDILRSDVMMLKQENRQLRQQLAELDSLVRNKTDDMSGERANFATDIRQLEERVSVIEQRIDDLQQRILRMAAVVNAAGAQQASGTQAQAAAGETTPEAASPRDIFDLAYRDYTASQYQIAIEGFRDFLNRFPESSLAPEALLYIGNSYRAMKKHQEAIESFRRIIDEFPDSPLHADALYKIGDSLIESGDRSRGEVYLQTLIQKFPDTNAARLARAKLSP